MILPPFTIRFISHTICPSILNNSLSGLVGRARRYLQCIHIVIFVLPLAIAFNGIVVTSGIRWKWPEYILIGKIHHLCVCVCVVHVVDVNKRASYKWHNSIILAKVLKSVRCFDLFSIVTIDDSLAKFSFSMLSISIIKMPSKIVYSYSFISSRLFWFQWLRSFYRFYLYKSSD